MSGHYRPARVVACALFSLSLLALWTGGCAPTPSVVPPAQQKPIDRRFIEYPAGTELRPLITGLTAPTAIAFDNDGTMLVCESGIGGGHPRIFGYKPDGTFIEVYPKGQRLPFQADLPFGGFRIYGPIGGMVVAHGKIYVTHRDNRDRGVITAFDYEGNHTTIVADLPARGDHSVTDIALAPDGRLYFGVGTATNSGVVGLDNLDWLRRWRTFADQPWVDQPDGAIYLLGRRFDTYNPFGGLFAGPDIAVTGPFQPFGKSIETRIPRPANGKPSGAIYSIDASGGDLRVEAHGIRNPVGLTFNEFGRLYMTNQGMKLRGTRPVKDDPDVLLKMVHGQWYGWPDFSADLRPIRDPAFQPPVEMIVRTGYRDLSFLIDHEASRLSPPTPRQSNLLAGAFKPLAGAAKFDFLPASGPLGAIRQGRNVAIVALSGPRLPFDTSGMKLDKHVAGTLGYKLVQVNVDNGQVEDFIRNTQDGPLSTHDGETIGLERPIDVKVGPDGAVYILDFGRMDMRGPRPKIGRGSGGIYKLVGLPRSEPRQP